MHDSFSAIESTLRAEYTGKCIACCSTADGSMWFTELRPEPSASWDLTASWLIPLLNLMGREQGLLKLQYFRAASRFTLQLVAFYAVP